MNRRRENRTVKSTITSVGTKLIPVFAVSLRVTLLVNPMVGYGYFHNHRDYPLYRYQIILVCDRGTLV